MRNILFLFLILLITGCNEKGDQIVERSWGSMQGLENLVGNMDDTSYSGVRSHSRLNALNIPVKISNYGGKYLWAEYAASWCHTCAQQVPQVKQAEAILYGEVNFITVMTGKSTKYDDHATVDTAKTWAAQYQHDPQHVYAAKLWYKTIPEHRFFSPEGHTLFVHVGYLNTQQIVQIINFYIKAWQEYQQIGIYNN